MQQAQSDVPLGFICTASVISKVAPSASTTLPVLFTRTLSLGSIGADVKALQVYLNNNGFIVATSGLGSTGMETNRFGPATKAALIKFQNAHASVILTPQGLTQGNGVFGPATRKLVNEIEK